MIDNNFTSQYAFGPSFIIKYLCPRLIAEAVVWFNPLIVADLDTTGVVAGFGITITNLYSSGDPVRGDPEAAD